MHRRLSGLQWDVIKLYRGILREAKRKDADTLIFAKTKFRDDASSIRRHDFKQIEFMLRQGHKRLKLLSMPGVKGVGSK